jgi:hypothetical protein
MQKQPFGMLSHVSCRLYGTPWLAAAVSQLVDVVISTDPSGQMLVLTLPVTNSVLASPAPEEAGAQATPDAMVPDTAAPAAASAAQLIVTSPCET